jgi:hypothetical protein
VIVLNVRNVNEALPLGMALMAEQGVERHSRGGPVIEVPQPVSTVYSRPQERVLFSPERDANPFFHFFEGLWMLEGRNDVGFLRVFNPRMAEFSDDGELFHGAYGFRWREWFGFDQLTHVTHALFKNPEDRRAVVAMWSPNGDAVSSEGAGGSTSRDLPCNTHIYFKVRADQLHMTVCNRSNDMLWGAYGANVVHMSMLQEYIANKLGIEVGPYTQVSDSLHVYTEGPGGAVYSRVKERGPVYEATKLVKPAPDLYTRGLAAHYPMAADCIEWDLDMQHFFRLWDHGIDPSVEEYQTPFWDNVVKPLWKAWRLKSPPEARKCSALDWRHAALEWLSRRGK